MNRVRHILHLYIAFLRVALFGGVLGLVAAFIYISVRKDRQSTDSLLPALLLIGTVVLGFVLRELPWNRGVAYLRGKRNELRKSPNERVARPVHAIDQSGNRNETANLSATRPDFLHLLQPTLPRQLLKPIEQLFAIRLPVR